MEINSELYLVTNVIRVGKMLQESVKKNEKSTSSQSFRRPYGAGVLPLSLLLSCSNNSENLIDSEEKEHNFRLYQCEEKDFYQLHEMLIKKTSGKYSPINGNGNNSFGIGVSVKILHGELLQARQEQPLLFQGSVITRKIGFPEIILPVFKNIHIQSFIFILLINISIFLGRCSK